MPKIHLAQGKIDIISKHARKYSITGYTLQFNVIVEYIVTKKHHLLSILGRNIGNNQLKELPSGIFSDNTKLYTYSSG